MAGQLYPDVIVPQKHMNTDILAGYAKRRKNKNGTIDEQYHQTGSSFYSPVNLNQIDNFN